MLKSLFVVLVTLSCTAACASQNTTITPDVIYGHKDGMALTYDVFTPVDANGAGVAYMVSGGWFSIWLPPENRLEVFSELLAAGYTVFAVHHGSAPRFKVPDAVSDVRAAIRHIKGNTDRYGVAADRLGVFGGSAGGHLSLMLGLNAEGQYEAPTGTNPRASAMVPQYLAPADADATLAAVVAYYPPIDLREIAGPNERYPALDFSKDRAVAISPILFIDANDPPVQLIHGDSDTVVPLIASTVIKAEFDKVGVTNDLLVIEGADHGFLGDDDEAEEASAALVAWFNEHLAE